MSDRRIPKVGAKLLSSMLVASLTAVAIGAVDGAYAATAGGLSAGRSALSAAGAVGLVGLLLGVGQGLLLEAASWAERRLRVSARWADRLESEAVVVAIHAHVVSFAVACLASVPPLYFAAASSVAIQEDAMRFVLLTGAGVMCVAAALVLRAIAFALALRLFGWMHRRIGLPRPRSRGLRYLVYVVVPATALMVPFMQHYGELLGVLLQIGALALFVLWEGVVYIGLRAAATRWLRFAIPLGPTFMPGPSARRFFATPGMHRASLLSTLP